LSLRSVGDLGDGSWLVEIVEHLECLAGQQLGELDVGVLADEVLIEFDGASIRRDDPFSPAVAFRVDEPLLDEVTDGTGEVASSLWSSFIASSEIVSPRSTVERASSSIRRSTV